MALYTSIMLIFDEVFISLDLMVPHTPLFLPERWDVI